MTKEEHEGVSQDGPGKPGTREFVSDQREHSNKERGPIPEELMEKAANKDKHTKVGTRQQEPLASASRDQERDNIAGGLDSISQPVNQGDGGATVKNSSISPGLGNVTQATDNPVEVAQQANQSSIDSMQRDLQKRELDGRKLAHVPEQREAISQHESKSRHFEEIISRAGSNHSGHLSSSDQEIDNSPGGTKLEKPPDVNPRNELEYGEMTEALEGFNWLRDAEGSGNNHNYKEQPKSSDLELESGLGGYEKDKREAGLAGTLQTMRELTTDCEDSGTDHGDKTHGIIQDSEPGNEIGHEGGLIGSDRDKQGFTVDQTEAERDNTEELKAQEKTCRGEVLIGFGQAWSQCTEEHRRLSREKEGVSFNISGAPGQSVAEDFLFESPWDLDQMKEMSANGSFSYTGIGVLSTTMNLKPDPLKEPKDDRRKRFHKVSLVNDKSKPSEGHSPFAEKTYNDGIKSPREIVEYPFMENLKQLPERLEKPSANTIPETKSLINNNSVTQPASMLEDYNKKSTLILKTSPASHTTQPDQETVIIELKKKENTDSTVTATAANSKGQQNYSESREEPAKTTNHTWDSQAVSAPVPEADSEANDIYRAVRVEFIPSSEPEERDTSTAMDNLVDTLRGMEPPHNLRLNRGPRPARPVSLPSFSSLPAIEENLPSPDVTPIPSSRSIEFQPHSPVPPAPGQPPKLQSDFGFRWTPTKDMLSPLEMMKKQLEQDSVDKPKLPSLLQRSSSETSNVYKNTQLNGSTLSGSLLSDRLDSKLTPTEDKLYSRLNSSLLFSSIKAQEVRDKPVENGKAISLPDSFFRRSSMPDLPSSVERSLSQVDGPKTSSYERFSYLTSSADPLSGGYDPRRNSLPPPSPLEFKQQSSFDVHSIATPAIETQRNNVVPKYTAFPDAYVTPVPEADSEANDIYRAVRVEFIPSSEPEERDTSTAMDNLVDTLRGMEPPHNLRLNRGPRPARPVSLPSFSSLPAIDENLPSPDVTPIPSSRSIEFQPHSPVPPAPGQPPKLQSDFGFRWTPTKDMLSPLEMMKKQLEQDSVDKPKLPSLLQRSSSETSNVYKNTQLNGSTLSGSLLSDRLDSKLTPTEDKLYSRLNSSLLFSSIKAQEVRDKPVENGKAISLPDSLFRRSSMPDLPSSVERSLSQVDGPKTSSYERFSYLTSSADPLSGGYDPRRNSLPPPSPLEFKQQSSFDVHSIATPAIETQRNNVVPKYTAFPDAYFYSVRARLTQACWNMLNYALEQKLNLSENT
ncbi:hypothetical protein EOD39_14650 [Acipenser ruthenus]|uniref:Uncharacterized protein n=1 Tax=Acipenser ruthenus TaxID=7906 RepID=A0A662YM61_ACIRT|nr:hypothetical protein EOD39_14650 [Acipenser ruthenus]